MTAIDSLSRLQSAQREFDRVAAETLAMLEDYRQRSLEREQRMAAVTREAIDACDHVLATLSQATP